MINELTNYGFSKIILKVRIVSRETWYVTAHTRPARHWRLRARVRACVRMCVTIDRVASFAFTAFCALLLLRKVASDRRMSHVVDATIHRSDQDGKLDERQGSERTTPTLLCRKGERKRKIQSPSKLNSLFLVVPWKIFASLHVFRYEKMTPALVTLI